MCEPLLPFAEHFFTTRQWRLGERTLDLADGWAEVAEAVSIAEERVARLHQVHRADVVTYKKGARPPHGPLPKADIVLSDEPATAVAIQTADCLPILIVDRRTHAVGAAHAGWRGLRVRAPFGAVAGLVAEFGSDPHDLMVAVGPSIGACCYEVGEDVRGQFADGFGAEQIGRWFLPVPQELKDNPPLRSLSPARRPNHWFFDAWTCAREQLEFAGVPRDQIFIAGLCTASHETCFCSYRRDGAIAGRMAAVIRPGPSPR
jgi:polyphenol oxidase